MMSEFTSVAFKVKILFVVVRRVDEEFEQE